MFYGLTMYHMCACKTKLQAANYLDYLGESSRHSFSLHKYLEFFRERVASFPEIIFVGFHRDAIFGRYYIPASITAAIRTRADINVTQKIPLPGAKAWFNSSGKIVYQSFLIYKKISLCALEKFTRDEQSEYTCF